MQTEIRPLVVETDALPTAETVETLDGLDQSALLHALRKLRNGDFRVRLPEGAPGIEGSIAETFQQYPHVGALLPAMGYGRQQMDDLRATIEASGAELVLIGTPIDLRRLIDFDVPALRVTYRLQEVGEPTLADVLGEAGLIKPPALV